MYRRLFIGNHIKSSFRENKFVYFIPDYKPINQGDKLIGKYMFNNNIFIQVS